MNANFKLKLNLGVIIYQKDLVKPICVMIKILRNSISIFLLWTLLFPTIVKVEHNHELFSCDAKSEQHIHQFHQKCDICTFEFPVFETTQNNICFKVEQIVTDFYDKHNSPNLFNSSKYSFLLRAPPCRQA